MPHIRVDTIMREREKSCFTNKRATIDDAFHE